MLCIGITIFLIGLVLVTFSLTPNMLEKEYIALLNNTKRTYSTLGVTLTSVGFLIVGFALFLKLI